MLKKTILNGAHRALHARMVDFGGWDMPVNYGSQIEEHRAVREDCGMFDVSHMCPVDLTGAACRPFLSRLLANDVARLQEPGKALYSAMLNEEGGIIDDLIVYFLSEAHFRIVLNAGTADADLAWMRARAAEWKLDVGIDPRREGDGALGIIAVQGPNARARVCQVLPQAEAAIAGLKSFFAAEVGLYFIARTGYTGEDGVEIMLPASEAEGLWNALREAGVAPCGLGARDTLRLEAGMNLHGQDMDAGVSPLDAGLAWTVAMTDGRNFVGRAALAARGQQKQFLGLLLLDKGVLRAHQKVVTAHGDGEITSGTFSPTLQRSIALARLPLGARVGDNVEVDIRGKRLRAEVVKPVFVRHGKAVI